MKFTRFKIYFFHLLILFAVCSGTKTLAQNNILETGINKLNPVGCSIQNGAIDMVGNGSFFAKKASFSSSTTLEEIDEIFDVKVLAFDTNGTFRFAIGKQYDIAGTMVEFAGNSSVSAITVDKLDNTLITNVQQFTLPFVLSIDTLYTIRIGKRIRNLTIEIRSASTYYLNDSLNYPSPFYGCLWGTPFIATKYGEVSVSNFTLSTPFNLHPRLLTIGDSFIEGNALNNVQDRYISLIQDSIGFQNTAISGRGGETTAKLNARFTKEAQWFKDSKYALLAVGVNDNSFSTWLTNTLKDIDSLKKHNTIPILATLSPRYDRSGFIVQVNNWIRTSYNGAYVDVNQALSSDGTTWLPGYYNILDTIHPSETGHRAIFERIKIEAPYLFYNTDPLTINYFNETTVEPLSDSMEYSLNTNFTVANSGINAPVPLVPGTTIYFKDTIAAPAVHSLYSILLVPPRPMIPTDTIAYSSPGVFDWVNNPNFISVSDYEYSIDSGINWATCVQKPILEASISSVQLRIKATSSNFKSTIFTIYNNVLVSTPTLAKAENVKVYPNPARDILTIENISEKTQLIIASTDGREIKTVSLSEGTAVINIQELKPGFYIFTLITKSGTDNFKILKTD